MGNNIVIANVTIKGVRPLLWHHFGPDALPLEKQERTGVAGNDPEEWKRSVLMTKNRQLYVGGDYVFATIRNGAKNIKQGRGSIQMNVAATLQVLNDRVLVDRFVPEEKDLTTDPEELVYLDIRSVKNPSTKARNVRYRIAASSGWKMEFQIMWDVTMVSRNQMESAVRDSGQFVGIGDGRSIGYGRFVVESFEVQNAEKETA